MALLRGAVVRSSPTAPFLKLPDAAHRRGLQIVLEFRLSVRVLMLGLLLAVLLSPSAANATAQQPDVVIREVFSALLSELNRRRDEQTLDAESAREVFADLLNPRIDYALLARWILREHWADADDEQRRAFISAFQAYIINTYALALSGEQEFQLEVTDNPRLRKNTAIVAASITVAGASTVPLEFRLIERDERWLLFDVSFAGVSLALTFRSDFNYVAQNGGGIDAVTTHLVQRAGIPAAQ